MIGYVVEGGTDRAFVRGLANHWCPDADLLEIAFRGSSCKHRHYPKVCSDASLRGVDVLVMLTDANNERWTVVRDAERAALPNPCPVEVLIGVCDRNVECWLCADRDYAARMLRCTPEDLDLPDPKGAFARRMRLVDVLPAEEWIERFVENAPLHAWIRRSPSFRGFYGDVRDYALRMGCDFPNEEEAHQ